MACQRELWRIISGSEVRFMCNITTTSYPPCNHGWPSVERGVEVAMEVCSDAEELQREHSACRSLMIIDCFSVSDLLSLLCHCKGTSVHFPTSPILSHSPPVHMYSPSSPLYYLQGLHLQPTTSRPDSPMTLQKLTHQQSTTSHVPIRSYFNSIGRT
jgi:hypothetical protein